MTLGVQQPVYRRPASRTLATLCQAHSVRHVIMFAMTDTLQLVSTVVCRTAALVVAYVPQLRVLRHRLAQAST